MNRRDIKKIIDPGKVFHSAFFKDDQINIDGITYTVNERMEYASYLYGLRIIISSCAGGIISGIVLKNGYNTVFACFCACLCVVIVSALTERRAVSIFTEEIKRFPCDDAERTIKKETKRTPVRHTEQ